MTPDTLPNRATPAPSSKSTDVVLTRRRWDCYFLPTTLIATVTGIGLSWATGEVKYLSAPVAPVGLWMFIRYNTPRTGMTDRRVSSQPEVLWLLAWAGFAVLILLAIDFFISIGKNRRSGDPYTWSDLAWIGPYFLVFGLGIFVIGCRYERRVNRGKSSPAAADGV